MTDLIQLTAAELSEKLQSGDVSSEEATRAHLDRIAEVDGDIHAFLATNEEASLDAARAVDARRASGESLGELAGVPLALKDVLVTTDMPTTSGSKILADYRSPFDATTVAKARAAGLVAIGKTNMDGVLHRALGLRPHAQPVEPRPRTGRFGWRVCSRCRGI